MSTNRKLGIIAGNGRFPFLVLDAARAQGFEVVVAAIKDETSPDIRSHGATVRWLSSARPFEGEASLQEQDQAVAGQAGQPNYLFASWDENNNL
jgi:UDP-2,3-diacylglucosamine hydrolase